MTPPSPSAPGPAAAPRSGEGASPDHEVVPLDRDVTMVLVILNAAVFVAEQLMKPRVLLHFQYRYQLSLDGIRSGAVWQLLSYQFLHGGGWHLAFNLMFLHSLGPVLESTFGRWRYLLAYLGAGVMGGLVHLAGATISPEHFSHPVVGASAGLCGLLAALGAIYAEVELPLLLFFLIPVRVKAKWVLAGFALITVAGTLVPVGRVAHLSHLGGLLGGLIAVNLLRSERLELMSAGRVPLADGRR